MIEIKAMRFILNTLKLPVVVLVMGLSLLAIAKFLPDYVQKSWADIFMYIGESGKVLILMSSVLFVYLLIIKLLKAYQNSFHEKNLQTSERIISILRNVVSVVFVLISINVLISVLDLNNQYLKIVDNAIHIIIIVAICVSLLQILALIENVVYNQSIAKGVTAETRKSAGLYTKIHITRNVVSVVIIILAVASSLMVFEKVRNIGISLLASAGVLTAILALAAQKTLSSLFAGIQLLITQPLEIGDWITVEDKFGVIEEITLSYVTIKIGNGRRFIVPINYFLEKPFQNWSQDSEGFSGVVKVFLDYNSPYGKLKTELESFIKTHALWDKQTCAFTISACRENNIELSINVSATTPSHLEKLHSDIREKLLHHINKNGDDYLPKVRISQQNNELNVSD